MGCERLQMKSGRNEEKAEVVPAFGNPNRRLAAVLSYNGPSRTFGFGSIRGRGDSTLVH